MSNPLTDVIPKRWRKQVYAAAVLVGLGETAWQGAHHNVQLAGGAFVASLVPLLAHGNTDTSDVQGD